MPDFGIDGRSTTCRKWMVIDGRRTACGKTRFHDDPCSWETVMFTDDSPFRDVGPYLDVAQAMKQYALWSKSMPVGMWRGAAMKIMEAVKLVGITPTAFEQDYVSAALRDPVLAMILRGWLMRAAHPYLLREQTARSETVKNDTEGE